MPRNYNNIARPHARRRAQSGVVLLVTLIALIIVLVGALALMRSSDTTSVIAGNIAFKRDLTNNAEIGVSAALAQFATGTLATVANTYTNQPSANYSATILTSSPGNRGIPDVLLNDSQFSTVGTSSLDLPAATYNGVTIRYVIDRMCNQTGEAAGLNCVLSKQSQPNSGPANGAITPAAYQTVYRISIRVQGPRNTQAFVQTTVGN